MADDDVATGSVLESGAVIPDVVVVVAAAVVDVAMRCNNSASNAA